MGVSVGAPGPDAPGAPAARHGARREGLTCEVTVCPPRRPDKNGYVERYRGTLGESIAFADFLAQMRQEPRSDWGAWLRHRQAA